MSKLKCEDGFRSTDILLNESNELEVKLEGEVKGGGACRVSHGKRCYSGRV